MGIAALNPSYELLRTQNAYDTLNAKRRIADQLAKIEPYRAA